MPQDGRIGQDLPEEERQRQSRAILDRVARDSAVIGASALAEAARDGARRSTGSKDADDRGLERLAAWIGRGLGFLFALYLVFYIIGR